MYLSGLLTTIGNTPLIKLERISTQYNFNVYAKLEFFNPSGSLKDRAALSIIQNAIVEKKIKKDTTIIECSSGNFALGLAMICKYLKLQFICIIDPKVTKQHIELLRLYGAKILQILEPDPSTGEFLPSLINKVKSLLREIPNSFWPNQHANLNNAKAHHKTMEEITNQLQGKIDYLFCATSSCGTLRGCHDFIKTKKFNTKIYAVDAEGSKIFSKAPKKRIIPGHGAGIIPDLYHGQINCESIIVSARASINGCKELFDQEAILAGGSSGALISAIKQVNQKIKPNSNCVVILCDRGERYIDTLYSDIWIAEHLETTFEIKE